MSDFCYGVSTMKFHTILISLALLFAIPGSSFQVEHERTEWIAYGQTLMASNAGVDNPFTHDLGVVGEVNLPYVVPDGMELHLVSWGVEAYDFPGTVVIAPWLGDYPRLKEKFLHSCAAGSGSVDCTGMDAILPPGTRVNGRLINGEIIPGGTSAVYSWYIRGFLEPIE